MNRSYGGDKKLNKMAMSNISKAFYKRHSENISIL